MELTEKTPVTRYDIDLLNKITIRDNATLIGSYESLNVYSVINFLCKCSKEGSKKFRSLYNKGGAFCKDCAKINGKMKSEATNLEKFGVKNPFASKDIQAKIRRDNFEKYGVEHTTQRKDIVEIIKNTNNSKSTDEKRSIINKIKSTLIKNYGVENTSQSPIVKKKKEETVKRNYGVSNPSQSDIIKKRKEITNLENHGVINVFQNEVVKRKIKNSNLIKYGVENIMQSGVFKEKIRESNLIKYGVEHPSQCVSEEETLRRNEKRKNTCIERFGVDNPVQNIDVQDKMQKSCMRFKEYTMPSGKIRKIQGYEPYALDELVKTYEEDQIKTDRKEVGRIMYKMDSKTKYYYPDIGIPHENKLIEVKSKYTYSLEPEKIKCKGEACKNLGFDYEIWVYNSKGEKEIIKF